MQQKKPRDFCQALLIQVLLKPSNCFTLGPLEKRKNDIYVLMSAGKDNRKHLRAGLIAEIQYVCDSTVLKARISDISAGGIFIDTINPLELGKTVRFSVTVPQEISEKPILGEGVVSWRQEMMGMGLRFTRMGKDDWEKIRKYLVSLPK